MGWSERVIRSANVGMSVVGRLSTQKNPMSSKHLIAKLLPAPLSPVMTTNDRGAVITPRPSALPGREPALVRGQDAELLAVVGDLAQRPLALIHALDQPQRGPELLLDVLLGLVAGAGRTQERAVEPVHPEARNAVLVEDDRVLGAELVDEDVGHDVARVVASEAPA